MGKRIYKLNEAFFDNIDTEAKAYILGFIAADGHNSLNKKIQISLNEKDIDILEKISSYIYLDNNNIKRFDSKQNIHSEEKIYKHVKMCICSAKLSNRLLELGFNHKKSATLEFPIWLNKDLIRHYVRGYFDGDGCIFLFKEKGVQKAAFSIISSIMFIEKLEELLVNELRINFYKSYPSKGMSVLSCRGTQQSYAILQWMYNDSSIYLNRKYNTFKELGDYIAKYGRKRYILFKPEEKKIIEEKCCELYLQGNNCSKISELMNIPARSINTMLHKNNISLRK